MIRQSNRTRPFPRLLHILTGLLVWGALVAIASPAHAVGRVVWSSTTLQENTKRESWKLALEIHLPSPPDVAYVPMKFEFEPKALYERSLVDEQPGPVERTVPLTGHQHLVESVDVGFLDAGSGQVQTRTRFTFKITRAHGFQAGEYRVTIKDARDGKRIGVPTTLRLKGENPVIDRRSIVFHGNDKKKAKEEAPPSETEATEAEEAAEEPAATEELETAPEPRDEGEVPPSIEEKPGGGCHHGPPHAQDWGWLSFCLALGSLLLLNLRRRGAS